MREEFRIDLLGRLWRGDADGWLRFAGHRADGTEIWTACQARPPLRSTRIPPADAERLIRETAAK